MTKVNNYGVARTGGGYVYQREELPVNDIQTRSPIEGVRKSPVRKSVKKSPAKAGPKGDSEKMTKDDKQALGTYLMNSANLEGELE